MDSAFFGVPRRLISGRLLLRILAPGPAVGKRERLEPGVAEGR
ncbi:hypothetical protein C4K33_4939 [Pseudomonas chlororaphis subsp. piscium]|nr:hypothetical protein C4K33_4939 [Pseudomonas chlororaphis subsp. piscium]AZC71649.1 hypothetical protein C4K32_5010 [Pseudomonas chlororaphis subsp. piscium]AZC84203.1 hypothetical protein C4K30_5112 [Pseudomonas chlororaphis subsp. piscium]